jgi:outer membrane protein
MNDRHQGKPSVSENPRFFGFQGHHAGLAAVFLRNAIVVALLSFVQSAHAFDYAAPFIDPLRTLPDRIESGVSLPGDSRPATCPVSKDFSNPLSLAEAVDLALCNNPQIKAAWASIKVQASSVGEARAAYLPTLTGTTNYQITHTINPGSNVAATTTNGQAIYATLAWRLFDFGGRGANLESANRLLVSAITNHEAALQKKLTAVIQAYFDAHTANATLQAKVQNESIAGNTLETAQRREARGAVARSDTLQATTALAKASLEKNRAIGSYQKALSVLVYTLGIPPQTSVIMADELKDKEALESRGLQAWLEIAEKAHPAILAVRAQLESAKQKITSTRSEGLPTVDLSATYYQNGYPGQALPSTQSQVSSIGVSLAIPFFDGFSRTYKIRGAEAQAEQREAEVLDTEHNTLMEVVKAYADAAASLLNLQASEKLLSAAQESLNTSQRKYEKGAADILEILNTQAALSDALQERIRSLDEWRSSRLRLLASAGMLGREAVVP